MDIRQLTAKFAEAWARMLGDGHVLTHIRSAGGHQLTGRSVDVVTLRRLGHRTADNTYFSNNVHHMICVSQTGITFSFV